MRTQLLLPLLGLAAVLHSCHCSARTRRSASGDWRSVENCELQWDKLEKKRDCAAACEGVAACFQKCEMDWQCPCAGYSVNGKERAPQVSACLDARKCGRARLDCRQACPAGAGSADCTGQCELDALRCECECNAAPAALRPVAALLALTAALVLAAAAAP